MKLGRCICNIPVYDIKEIRVLWNSQLSENKDCYQVTKLIVAPFRYFGDNYKQEMDFDHSENTYENEHLYDTYNKDIGNCNFSLWEKPESYLVQYLMLKFFSDTKYINDKVKEESFFEFLQIKQMRDLLVDYYDLCDNTESSKEGVE